MDFVLFYMEYEHVSNSKHTYFIYTVIPFEIPTNSFRIYHQLPLNGPTTMNNSSKNLVLKGHNVMDADKTHISTNSSTKNV